MCLKRLKGFLAKEGLLKNKTKTKKKKKKKI